MITAYPKLKEMKFDDVVAHFRMSYVNQIQGEQILKRNICNHFEHLVTQAAQINSARLVCP